MNKYLITVIVPIVEFEYDIYIPNNKKIEEVRMIDRDTGNEFENNMYVKDSGIKNGSKIIII